MPALQKPCELRVAIILVNWNGWRECIECLNSLLAQAHRQCHIYLVDNDSTDGSIEHIVDWCSAPTANSDWRRHPEVGWLTDESKSAVRHRVLRLSDPEVATLPAGCRLTLLRAGANLGFAGGCNVGIRAAEFHAFDFVWLLNPDTVVGTQALSALLERAREASRPGMVGSTLRYYERPDIVQALGGGRLNRSNGTSALIGEGLRLDEIPGDTRFVEREMAYVMGASMLVSTAFVRDIGPMQEDYFLYYEEIDWALRAKDRFSLGFAAASHVFHKSGANSSKVMPAFSSRFYYRNRLRFVARFFPRQLTAAKWSLVEGLLRQVVNGRWAQARVIASTLLHAGKITATVNRGP